MQVYLKLSLVGALVCGLYAVDELASDELPEPARCLARPAAAPTCRLDWMLQLGLHLGRGEQIAREDGPFSRLIEELKAARAIATQDPQLQVDGIDAILTGFHEGSRSRDALKPITELQTALLAELQSRNASAFARTCSADAWAGTWQTTYGTLVLARDKPGAFSGYYGTAEHSLTGEVDPHVPGVLEGVWREGTSIGRFRFVMESAGHWSGEWTSGETPPTGHVINWKGDRQIVSAQGAWSGTWNTSYGPLVLDVDAKGQATGCYGVNENAVSGTVDTNQPTLLRGRWQHTDSDWNGRFEFRLLSDDHWEGAWTAGEADPAQAGVNWQGTRHPMQQEIE
ncbi:MAG: hypothetical protein KDA75_13645 [Planctomycetaceae bacterium]|nr:hypothetical protein [Planctomycetaceae bacterium]